ncbi:MAG: DUF2855 family protein [Sulfitobacter sp.]|nr:DUF2855 family protein [Sulfitobacter sp.]
MKRLLIDQKKITETRVEEIARSELKEGEARLRLENFALTANNVTYAASGFAIGYWQFFPTGQDGQGLVPVWGVGVVEESRSAALEVGARLYGFYPLAEELVMQPQADGHGGIVDAAAHRTELPAVYNRYAPVKAGPAEDDHLRALLQPLLATSYLLFDWLMDNDCFGAEQIIVGSASSKTGLGLCKYLSEPQDRSYRVVGLTSSRNKEFVEKLRACDNILTYKEIAGIGQVPSVYVDMSGNAEVKVALHAHLADNLRHSAAVGISHWDQFDPTRALEGVKPQFFFAPAQIAKRREEWGPGEIERRITAAWKRLAADASDWMEIKVHKGVEQAAEVYDSLARGTANPRDGHVIRFD